MDTIELMAERWETPELAAQVRSILDAIDAPPADSEVMLQLQRVARLYGDRPDVTGRARNWRVLAVLSSTTLSESARRALEAQILAGGVVTAKSIVAQASGAARKSGRRS
jgi:hypothetical protein